MNKYCPHCGKPLQEGAAFCAHCGARIEPESAAATADGSTHGAAPEPVMSRAVQAPAAPGDPSVANSVLAPAGGAAVASKKWIVAVAAAAVAVLLLVLIVLVFAGGRNQDADTAVPAESAQPQEEEATEEPAQTPAPTPEPAPEPTPEPAASNAPVSGLTEINPEAVIDTAIYNQILTLPHMPALYKVTVNGAAIDAPNDGTQVYIKRGTLNVNDIVRVIGFEVDGSCWTAVLFVDSPGFASATLSLEGACSEDGALLSVDDPLLFEEYAWYYYLGYLRAINDQDPGSMVFSTAANTQRMKERIGSDANAANYFDTSSAVVTMDIDSFVFGDGAAAFNATYRSRYTNRETGQENDLENHQTVYMVWQNGMWMVDGFTFVSDDDFTAHRLAPMPD